MCQNIYIFYTKCGCQLLHTTLHCKGCSLPFRKTRICPRPKRCPYHANFFRRRTSAAPGESSGRNKRRSDREESVAIWSGGDDDNKAKGNDDDDDKTHDGARAVAHRDAFREAGFECYRRVGRLTRDALRDCVATKFDESDEFGFPEIDDATGSRESPPEKAEPGKKDENGRGRPRTRWGGW